MIDTFHLFDETHSFLERVENHYGFKAQVCRAQGCASREDFEEMYGDDLFISDVEKYDRVAKVEPLLRALRESATTLWINGRRRDQVLLSRRPPHYVPICALPSCVGGLHGRLGAPACNVQKCSCENGSWEHDTEYKSRHSSILCACIGLRAR